MLEVDCCSGKEGLSEAIILYLGSISANPINKILPEDMHFLLRAQTHLDSCPECNEAYGYYKEDVLAEYPETPKELIEQNEYYLRILSRIYKTN